MPGKQELNKSKSGDPNSGPLKVYTNLLSNDLSTFSLSTWTDTGGTTSKTTPAYSVWKKIGLACSLGADSVKVILQEQEDTATASYAIRGPFKADC